MLPAKLHEQHRMAIDYVPIGELRALSDKRVQTLHPARRPLSRISIAAVDFLVVLNDLPAGGIVVTIDAFLESAANLPPPLLIDVLVDLGLQPIEFAFGDHLENLASHDLGGGGHCW